MQTFSNDQTMLVEARQVPRLDRNPKVMLAARFWAADPVSSTGDGVCKTADLVSSRLDGQWKTADLVSSRLDEARQAVDWEGSRGDGGFGATESGRPGVAKVAELSKRA